jgi:cation diffusion facilitator CzcD-associated flavoprotein CzcO
MGTNENDTRFDVVIIGAGFSGMYMLQRLRKLGKSVRVIEAASDVGGTWWWNRYPGARCDIESMDYSYSFDEDLEQEWSWSERYATQPEILSYANHVADRYDLRSAIQFDTRMIDATWEADTAVWRLTTDRDERYSARFVVMAVGALSAAKRPEIEGIDSFAGLEVHTGRWPHDGIDFSGQRVAVIGTGSSGIQCIPLIAQQAEHLTVFQRTPAFTLPALNAPLDPAIVQDRKANYREHREATRHSHGGVLTSPGTESALDVDDVLRTQRFDQAWNSGTLFGLLSTFNDIMVTAEANDTAAEYVRSRIRSIVADPETAARLSPTTFPIGAKRLCLDTDYYATYNRPNVSLVDLQATPITTITPAGIDTTDESFEFDTIVFATGFDAMTGPLLAPNIIGVDGVELRDAWASGPRTYLGIASAGFPNMFMITGPGSPSVLTNMLVSIEQHVEWATDLIAWMGANSKRTFDPQVTAQDTWVQQVNDFAAFTLYPAGNSWYLGANVPGKPRVFMPFIGGVEMYRQICDDVAADRYRGIDFTP